MGIKTLGSPKKLWGQKARPHSNIERWSKETFIYFYSCYLYDSYTIVNMYECFSRLKSDDYSPNINSGVKKQSRHVLLCLVVLIINYQY